MMAPIISTTSYFRSDDYAPADRVAILHDVYASVERVNIEVLGEGAPYFSVAARELPDVSLFGATISPMAPRRTRQQVADGKDDVVFVFIESGDVGFEPHGAGELQLRGGEAYLGLNTRPSRHILVGKPKFFDVTISRAAIDSRVDVRDFAKVGKLAPSPALGLLKRYAEAIMSIDEALDEEIARRAADHLLDLAVLALGATRDHAQAATEQGLAFARLAAIKDDIRRNLVEPWLSIEEMARRHDISPQYLRSLFYRENTSFSDFVRTKRLERAYAMLTNPRHRLRRISEIAYACGFGDLSHFNKCFRQRYSMPPSEARQRS